MEHQIFELECLEPRQPSQQGQDDLVRHREDHTAKAPIPHILELPLIIVLLVLDLLDRKDVRAFGLVCRGYNRVVEPILFRKVVLNDWYRSNISSHICKRLADRHDSLAENVHHFQIGLSKVRNLLDVQLLEDVLENLKNLEDFSWHAHFPIPSDLLEKFHARHPYARLHARNPGIRLYRPPDYKILSSPQLHSLDYVIYRGQYYRETGRGGIPAIKDAFVHARNLKNLHFRLCYDYPTELDWFETKSFFKFAYGEVSPALEELTISHGGYRYSLTSELCQEWARSLSWSQLRRLYLDYLHDTHHLFEALAGKVSNLKAIKFDFDSVDSLLGFSDSIDGLEEIVIDVHCFDDFNEVREAFLSRHGHSLKKLHMDYVPWRHGFVSTEIQRLVEIAPGIQSLKLDVLSEHDNYMDWPEATMEFFSELQHLRELDVSICLDGIPDGQYETEVLRSSVSTGMHYPSRRPLYLKEDVAEKRVKAFYKQLFGIYPDSKIRCVKVTFETLEPINAWPFIVHRESPDGQRFRLEKGFYTGFSGPSPSMRQNIPTARVIPYDDRKVRFGASLCTFE